eukprot:GEZU01036496.1.p1 GENE.GEZU01036496.1~~GEZU01036496.1.p1  ORF type:complete len:164 (+),score=29.48 GEZU01036496.1:87-578(+)
MFKRSRDSYEGTTSAAIAAHPHFVHQQIDSNNNNTGNFIQVSNLLQHQAEEERELDLIGVPQSNKQQRQQLKFAKRTKSKHRFSSLHYNITVRTLTGAQLRLTLEPYDNIDYVKHCISELVGVPQAQQRIVFKGRQLADDCTLCECGVFGGSELHLVLALRGG